MSYRVYRVVGGKDPYTDFIASFNSHNSALAFCESENCQQANAIREKDLRCSFLCLDAHGAIEFEKSFKWDGLTA